MRLASLTLMTLGLVAGDVRLDAPLRKVRVYPDQAWLTREAVARFQAPGPQRIRVEGLPRGLTLESLRVQVEGIPGLRLGNVAVVEVPGRFEPDAAFLKHQAELRALEPRIADLRLRQAALEATLKALESMKPTARTDKATLDPLTLAEFSRAFQARHEAFLAQGLALAAECRPLEARASQLLQQMTEQESVGRKATTAVLVELEAPAPGQVRILLETRTPEARWKPAYEARLAEDGNTLELLCYAAVSQASGEPWSGIQLEISNAQPSRNLHLPTPEPGLLVHYEAPGMVTPGSLQGLVLDRLGRPVPGVQLTAFNEPLKVSRTGTTDANGAFRMPFLPAGTYRLRGTKPGHPELVAQALVENGKTQSVGLRLGEISGGSAVVEVLASAVSVDATTSQSASRLSSETLASIPTSRFMQDLTRFSPGVSTQRTSQDATPELALESPATNLESVGELGRAWSLEGTRTLPSDAQPRRMLLTRSVLPVSMRLRAVPRMSLEVFSLAAVTPEAGFPWFQGTPTTLFRAGERLGKVALPAPMAGEPVAFSFGPVPGLRVQRKRLEAKVLAAKAGRYRQWTLRERVTVVNDRDREVEVEVLEPTPRSSSDKVRLESLPEATPSTRVTPRGDTVWTLRVAARGQAKVEEAWRISGPGVGHVPELPALGLPTSD